eukprot:CAMPEP_0116119474 /NCGR_PEP_ID=MMETSP0329-20121206/2659_1 /TAXON_ID=697910 /ORGANISM="Pseudo-nitzschia arenysensis, Strain B593" /LENGTH=149 /DNA_ID=CAMNT_0003613175 /DNA_START=55 /DNA_END=500 /DNA_ORIENTATION=+
MQSYAFVLALVLVAAVQGFAPASQGRAGSQLNESLFDKVANMDLFAPKKDQNTYGARKAKNLKQGEITSKSYVPQGLSASDYAALRKKEAAKKEANYQRNVKKAGVFEDYTEFYMKRGTDTKQGWAKDVNLGHRMAKTKFDWSGKKVQA